MLKEPESSLGLAWIRVYLGGLDIHLGSHGLRLGFMCYETEWDLFVNSIQYFHGLICNWGTTGFFFLFILLYIYVY